MANFYELEPDDPEPDDPEPDEEDPEDPPLEPPLSLLSLLSVEVEELVSLELVPDVELPLLPLSLEDFLA